MLSARRYGPCGHPPYPASLLTQIRTLRESILSRLDDPQKYTQLPSQARTGLQNALRSLAVVLPPTDQACVAQNDDERLVAGAREATRDRYFGAVSRICKKARSQLNDFLVAFMMSSLADSSTDEATEEECGTLKDCMDDLPAHAAAWAAVCPDQHVSTDEQCQYVSGMAEEWSILLMQFEQLGAAAACHNGNGEDDDQNALFEHRLGVFEACSQAGYLLLEYLKEHRPAFWSYSPDLDMRYEDFDEDMNPVSGTAAVTPMDYWFLFVSEILTHTSFRAEWNRSCRHRAPDALGACRGFAETMMAREGSTRSLLSHNWGPPDGIGPAMACLLSEATCRLVVQWISNPEQEHSLEGEYFPAAWFARRTDITPERLRQAKARNKIRSYKKNGTVYYSFRDALHMWPADIETDVTKRYRRDRA